MPTILPTRSVEILCYPGVQLLDVAGPLQVFASANEFAPPDAPAPYGLAVVAAADEVVATAGLPFRTVPLPPAYRPQTRDVVC